MIQTLTSTIFSKCYFLQFICCLQCLENKKKSITLLIWDKSRFQFITTLLIQPANTCAKLRIELVEQSVKYVES